MKSYRIIIYAGLLMIIFAFLILVLTGCTTNQFETEEIIDVHIIGASDGDLLVKYKFGKTIIHDSINVENIALLTDLVTNKKSDTVKLKIKISGCDCPADETLSYYQIDGLELGQSNVMEFQQLYDIAKENPGMFNWKWMDGKLIKDEESKKEKLPPGNEKTELL